MKRLIPIALLLLLGMSSAAHADFYVGASFLSTDAEISDAVENFDTDDSSFKAYAGVTFFKFLGLEATYRDLGSHQETKPENMNSIDVDLKAYDVGVRGIIPIGKMFSLFGRVGYANIDASGSFEIDDIPNLIDDDEWELTYGVGLDVNFGSHFGIRAEWEEYDVDEDLNSLSAGVFIRF